MRNMWGKCRTVKASLDPCGNSCQFPNRNRAKHPTEGFIGLCEVVRFQIDLGDTP